MNFSRIQTATKTDKLERMVNAYLILCVMCVCVCVCVCVYSHL